MSAKGPYPAAIVGLGQVGLLFDEDKKRSGVWTHFTAYSRLSDRFKLVAVCEPDPDRRALALARFPGLRCYDNLQAMLSSEHLDVVSLCTPPELHVGQIQACAGKVKAIICEKPLGVDFAASERAVARCRETGTALGINYYKRFDGCVPHARDLLNQNVIGELHYAAALYSDPLEAVGSHALDLLWFLIGPLSLRYAAVITADRHAAAFTFGREGAATVVTTGPRERLVFEIDLIGSEGRLRILDNCARLEVYQFCSSPRYSGYRELFLEPARGFQTAERFLPLFVEVAELLDGTRQQLTADGESALKIQHLIEQIRGESELCKRV